MRRVERVYVYVCDVLYPYLILYPYVVPYVTHVPLSVYDQVSEAVGRVERVYAFVLLCYTCV